MIQTFALSVVLGWFGHKLKPGTRELFPSDSTNRLVSYAEGSLLIFAAFVILTSGRMERQDRETAMTQLLVSMLAIGLGTTVGTIADYVRAER